MEKDYSKIYKELKKNEPYRFEEIKREIKRRIEMGEEARKTILAYYQDNPSKRREENEKIKKEINLLKETSELLNSL